MIESCSTCEHLTDIRDLHLVRAWVLLKDGDKVAGDITICNQCLLTIDADLLDDGREVLDTDRELRTHR